MGLRLLAGIVGALGFVIGLELAGFRGVPILLALGGLHVLRLAWNGRN